MYYTKPKGLYFGTVPDGQGVPAMGERETEILTDAATIVVSCFLVAVGLDMFTIPNNIAPGGVSGLATAVAELVPLKVGALALLFNLPLLFAAWRVLGLKPLLKTLAATVLLSVLIDSLGPFLPVYTNNELLAAVLGGVLLGTGTGLLFLRGISTGGTDLLSILMLRPFPNLPVGYLLLCIDASVVVIAVLIFQNLEVALYSGVTIFISAKVIDGIMEGMNYAKVIYIVTERGEELTEALRTDTERGITAIPARGGYTGGNKTVLMTVTRRGALAQTIQVIKRTDPAAFLFVVNAAEVHGEGFKRYQADIGAKEK